MKNLVQHIQQPLRGHLGVDPVFKFQDGAILALIHAMTTVKIDPVFQLMFLDVFLDGFYSVFVSPGKTSAAKAYDQFFFIFFGLLVHHRVKIEIF
jgi:hypothetical protein